jgi:NAD(P)H-dependent FMN reductase
VQYHQTGTNNLYKDTNSNNLSNSSTPDTTANMSQPKKIGIIIGSTRPNRIGDQVSALIKSILEESSDKTLDSAPVLSLVDIAAFNLPVFNETIMPAMVPAQGEFAHEHSKAWTAEISKYDAYIFVTAEWNFGLPGVTKNAIDYLYHAWIGKPVMIVSYGIMGGMSASDSLKKTLDGMHLQVVDTRVSLTFPDPDPAQHNMSPGLMGAIGGKLIEAVKERWTTDAQADILKAYGELQAKLVPAAAS